MKMSAIGLQKTEHAKNILSSPIRFNEVLLADGMAWTLFGLAQQEGLLYTKKGEGFSGRPPSERDKQAVLSLFVLFDKLIVHDYTHDTGTYRFPDLEREGMLEVIAAFESSERPVPLESSWKPSKFDPRLKAPRSHRQSLALVRDYKPLIIDRLMSASATYDATIAVKLNISRRVYYSELLDLAIGYVTGNTTLLRTNLIEQKLSRRFLNQIKREFFDFGELISPANAILLLSLVFAEEIGVIREISVTRNLGVATRHYSRASKIAFSNNGGFTTDATQIPKTFGLVRSVLHEEGHFFPQIENITHALKLRKNPNLRAFKEQLREFHIQLVNGDKEALGKIRKEVKRAKTVLERTGKWDAALRWLTYISLPAGVVEGLLGGAPIAGTSLAVMSAAGAATNARAFKKNQWVMFGM